MGCLYRSVVGLPSFPKDPKQLAQIDTWTDEVIYRGSRDEISSIRFSKRVNGYSASEATIDGGEFASLGDGYWFGTDASQTRQSFKEVNRDEWSVYLQPVDGQGTWSLC